MVLYRYILESCCLNGVELYQIGITPVRGLVAQSSPLRALSALCVSVFYQIICSTNTQFRNWGCDTTMPRKVVNMSVLPQPLSNHIRAVIPLDYGREKIECICVCSFAHRLVHYNMFHTFSKSHERLNSVIHQSGLRFITYHKCSKKSITTSKCKMILTWSPWLS